MELIINIPDDKANLVFESFVKVYNRPSESKLTNEEFFVNQIISHIRNVHGSNEADTAIVVARDAAVVKSIDDTKDVTVAVKL